MSTVRHQTCSRKCTRREENHLAGRRRKLTAHATNLCARRTTGIRGNVVFPLPCSSRERIVRHVVTVIFHLGVVLQKDLDVMPRALYPVGVGPRVWIDEAEAMVNGAERVTLRVEIAIRTPPIADDRRACFDPFTYKCRQRVGDSERYGNKKCSAGPSFDSAKHTLTLNRVPSIRFSRDPSCSRQSRRSD